MTSPTSTAIDYALSAPTPTLRMLAPGNVYNLNDVLEVSNGVVVVGYSPLWRPGQQVTEYDVRYYAPRRYSI